MVGHSSEVAETALCVIVSRAAIWRRWKPWRKLYLHSDGRLESHVDSGMRQEPREDYLNNQLEGERMEAHQFACRGLRWQSFMMAREEGGVEKTRRGRIGPQIAARLACGHVALDMGFYGLTFTG